jgi:hypothetical protein
LLGVARSAGGTYSYFAAARSGTDLFTWSDPIAGATIGQTGDHVQYTTLVGEGADPLTGGSRLWLFYVRAPSLPFWSSATLIARTLSLTVM